MKYYCEKCNGEDVVLENSQIEYKEPRQSIAEFTGLSPYQGQMTSATISCATNMRFFLTKLTCKNCGNSKEAVSAQ